MVFRKDFCGFVCIAITYAAVIYADYAVTYHMVMGSMGESFWGPFNIVIFNTILAMLALSHIRAVTSDPGMVSLPTKRLDFSHLHSGKHAPGMDGWTVCGKCQAYRPPRSHHCRICGRCIRKMDHHCPWINNCVGEFNQKYFVMFLFYVGVASVYAISMVISYWALHPEFKIGSHDKEQKIMHTIILVVECLLFLLFVVAIGCDQACAILGDATMIEQLKKEGGQRSLTTREACSEVFGNSLFTLLRVCNIELRLKYPSDKLKQVDLVHPCLWLLPFNISGPRKELKKPMMLQTV